MDRDTITKPLIIESQGHIKDPGSLRLQKSLEFNKNIYIRLATNFRTGTINIH